MSEVHVSISDKLNGKRLGIIGVVLLILIALIMGTSIYNTSDNRLSRQLDLGNRYLEEQNYEQAIVEFDKAIEIDPMSVEAYLGKAQAYEGMDNIDMAMQTLQEGYDLTGDERLKEKLDEVQAQLDQNMQADETTPLVEEAEVQEEQDYIELPFSVSDIKIMGYDLLEPHFDEVIEAANYSDGQDDHIYIVETDHTWEFSYLDDAENGHFQSDLTYECWNPDGSRIHSIELQIYAKGKTNSMKDIMESWCEVPLLPGDTYEDWYEELGIDMIKDSSLVQIEPLSCGDARYTIHQDNNVIDYEEYRCDEHNTLGGDSQLKLSVYEFGEYDLDILGVFQDNTIIWVTYENFIGNIQ